MKVRIDKNDTEFSMMIRERDNHTCVFCGRKSPEWRMSCSHFWGRGNKATRFDPENCDTLCFRCHQENEGNKHGFYREWKLKQLGAKRYEALARRAQSIQKYGKFEKDALLVVLKEQRKNGEHFKKGWSVQMP